MIGRAASTSFILTPFSFALLLSNKHIEHRGSLMYLRCLSTYLFASSPPQTLSLQLSPLPPSLPISLPPFFFPVTKLAVSLSICWLFLQRPCTCSHLLSCWPPLLCAPPFIFLSASLSLLSLRGATLPGPFLARLAPLSFNPSVGKSTLFTAGGPSLFSSSRSTAAPRHHQGQRRANGVQNLQLFNWTKQKIALLL